METTFIYSLTDPNTLQIRYIGKSDCPHNRWLVHKNSCGERKTHCQRWIALLRESGTEPIVTVIEEVLKSEWPERERFWIEHYRQLGAPLTNTCRGGLGGPGRVVSEEEKRKAHDRFAGIPLSQEHRHKLSQAARRKYEISNSREVLSRHWATLTDEQARECRQLALQGELTDTEIAKRYGISAPRISEIRHGHAYRHAFQEDAGQIIDPRHSRAIPRMMKVVELRKSRLSFAEIAKCVGIRMQAAQRIIAKAIEGGYVHRAEVTFKRTVSEEGRKKLSQAQFDSYARRHDK